MYNTLVREKRASPSSRGSTNARRSAHSVDGELLTVAVRWPTLASYVRQLAKRIRLAPKLARYQMQADLGDTRFGAFWLLLSPLLVALPSIVVFGYLLEVDRGVEHYPLFALSGLMLFRLFSRTWVRCARSFRAKGRPNVPLGVPAGVGVFAHALHETVLALPGIALCLSWGFYIGAASAWNLPFAGLALLNGFLFATGFGLLIAAMSMRLADFAEALPHLVRPLTYASGVWFIPTAYLEGTGFEPFFEWNPLLLVLELFRAATVSGPLSSPSHLGAISGAILVSNAVGLLFLWRSEAKVW